MSRGKFEHLQACTNADGIIAAVAMDQRNSLKKSMEKVVEGSGTPEAITTFKRKVSQVLTRYASAILLDPEYGLPALQERVQGRGALLSYEVTGYDPLVVGRLPRLLPNWSARRLIEVGTDAVKILLYYNPADVGWINEIKQAFVERVGDECRALDIPFFLEPLAYDNMHPEQSFEFACLKPGYVRSIIEEFSRPRYSVDMLKVEIPINSAYLAGSHGFKGNQVAYDWQEAREHFQALAAISSLPFIFLSGGVDDVIFREQLELASEASIPFSGVLCGRATWKGGIPVFVNDGEAALEEWLQEQGVQNVQTLNAVLSQCARPWHTIYGGLEAIQVTD